MLYSLDNKEQKLNECFKDSPKMALFSPTNQVSQCFKAIARRHAIRSKNKILKIDERGWQEKNLFLSSCAHSIVISSTPEKLHSC